MLKENNFILITGAAGFIGAALAIKLLSNGENVLGIDNLNDYYDISLKEKRLNNIKNFAIKNNCCWHFFKLSINKKSDLDDLFQKYNPRIIINLAAQAGVRYSLINPSSYINSNLVGFGNVLEACRRFKVEHLIYASSSSIYGGNSKIPFEESHSVDHPVSLYAATKKANELMAHSYSHLYKIPTTGLRFFTVYGPWGRPDMAPMIFANAILNKEPISIFNYGKMKRDFTYIDDIVEGIYRCCYKKAKTDIHFDRNNPNPSKSFAPYRIFNIGNSNPIELLKFIQLLEDALGTKAIKEFKPIQPGDVIETAAKTDLLEDWIEFRPSISLEEGIVKFAKWFIEFYK